jgi:hypothetical protein
MRTQASEPWLISGVSCLVRGEKEVDATIRPVHIAGAVTKSLHPTNLFFEILEQMVEPIQIISPRHDLSFEEKIQNIQRRS